MNRQYENFLIAECVSNMLGTYDFFLLLFICFSVATNFIYYYYYYFIMVIRQNEYVKRVEDFNTYTYLTILIIMNESLKL